MKIEKLHDPASGVLAEGNAAAPTYHDVEEEMPSIPYEETPSPESEESARMSERSEEWGPKWKRTYSDVNA